MVKTTKKSQSTKSTKNQKTLQQRVHEATKNNIIASLVISSVLINILFLIALIVMLDRGIIY
jgi:ABC-type protease/lipase transport system fused ATPase/permease subunit